VSSFSQTVSARDKWIGWWDGGIRLFQEEAFIGMNL
jgi:hypothetical protein